MLLGLAGFIVMADNWVVSPILPAISQNLAIDISRTGFLITAYMISFGVFQIIFGPLADRYGKKQVMTFAMIMFTIATGLCALGSSLSGRMSGKIAAKMGARKVLSLGLVSAAIADIHLYGDILVSFLLIPRFSPERRSLPRRPEVQPCPW